MLDGCQSWIKKKQLLLQCIFPHCFRFVGFNFVRAFFIIWFYLFYLFVSQIMCYLSKWWCCVLTFVLNLFNTVLRYIQYLIVSIVSCEFESRSWWDVLDTTLCDKVCQWLVKGRWFSPNTTVSSTNKADCHDITEILLKMALNPIPLFPFKIVSS